MESNFWSNLWRGLLYGLTLTIIISLFTFWYKDKKTIQYNINCTTSTELGRHYCIEEINVWGLNKTIYLKPDVSLDRTLQIIDSLNLNIKK